MIDEEMDEEMEEPSLGEDKCKQMKMMAMDLSPAEFQPMDLKIPTEAEDGAEVTVMLTGQAKGGFIQDVQGTEMVHDEQKPKGRLTKMMRGEEEE